MKFLDTLSRKLQILCAVVEKYVETGVPIGSKTILEEFEFPFSSATIRSDMAALSKGGYLDQIHISSGRIPSNLGYRLYINKVMREQVLLEEEKNLISGELLTCAPDPEKILFKAAKLLSEITNSVVIFTTPPPKNSRVKDIKLVKLGKKTVMIILNTTVGMVKSRIFRCDYDLTSDLLKTFSEVLEEKFVGRRLECVSPELVEMVAGINTVFVSLFEPILNAFLVTAKEASKTEILVEGQRFLLTFPELDFDFTLNIFEFLENKNKVLNLFSGDEAGIKFFIGEENTFSELKTVSLIISSYRVGGKRGHIGLIGSTRMNYSLIVARIQYVSAVVGALIERIISDE